VPFDILWDHLIHTLAIRLCGARTAAVDAAGSPPLPPDDFRLTSDPSILRRASAGPALHICLPFFQAFRFGADLVEGRSVVYFQALRSPEERAEVILQ